MTDDAAYAEVFVEADPKVLAALRSAVQRGYALGFDAGYQRNLGWAPKGWSGLVDVPDLEELQRRRGEHPDQLPPAFPRAGDYLGGPVASWE